MFFLCRYWGRWYCVGQLVELERYDTLVRPLKMSVLLAISVDSGYEWPIECGLTNVSYFSNLTIYFMLPLIKKVLRVVFICNGGLLLFVIVWNQILEVCMVFLCNECLLIFVIKWNRNLDVLFYSIWLSRSLFRKNMLKTFRSNKRVGILVSNVALTYLNLLISCIMCWPSIYG